MTIEQIDPVQRAKDSCKRVVDGFETVKAKHAKYGYEMACLAERQSAAIADLRTKIAALELMRNGKAATGQQAADFMRSMGL